MTDRELQHRELYVIQNESGNGGRHVVQIRTEFLRLVGNRPKECVWWCGDLAGWRSVGAVDGILTFARFSDGPYRPENLQGKLVGRVVGFAETALGDLLPIAAGYDNEEEGSAAFDPAKYLDVVISTGQMPYLMRGRDGHLS